MTEEVTMKSRLGLYIDETVAVFTLKDIYNSLNIYSICNNNTCTLLQDNPNYVNRKLCPNKELCIAKEKNHIQVILSQWTKPNEKRPAYVEKSKRLPGAWRRIDRDIVKLDIANAEAGLSIDLRFPLQLEKFIRVPPKCLIVIAGSSGAGKSAYCLNMACLNVDKHPIYYFANNEMTAHSIKERLLDYEFIGQVNMDNLNAYQRTEAFQDCVIPDGINIIDYVTIPSERPAIVSDYLEAIFNKITTGVVICAIQKKGNRLEKGKLVDHDLGVGGEWGKRPASVYLTMDSYPENKLVIRKCRERVHRDVDPIGFEYKYKLVNGINFWKVQYPDAYNTNKVAVKPAPWSE